MPRFCPYGAHIYMFAGLLLVFRQISLSHSLNTKRTSNLEKSLREKYMHTPGCQKCGVFHIPVKNIGSVIYFFVEKGGLFIYLAVLKRGTIRHAHPYYPIYRSPLPLPPPKYCPLTESLETSECMHRPE